MKNKIASICLILTLTIMFGIVGCGGGSKGLGNLTSSELFEKGKEKFDKGKYFQSTEYFQTLVYNYPGEAVVDSAQYFLALAYYSNKDYELAQIEFNRLILNYPSSVYFESSMLLRAVCAFRSAPKNYGLDQTNLTQAIVMLEDFLIDFPESEYLPEARAHLLEARGRLARKNYRNARVYMYMGAYSAAEVYFQIVIDEYTDTEYAPLALYGVGEALMKAKKFESAQDKFENFISLYPDHDLKEKAEKNSFKTAFAQGERAFERGEFEKAKSGFEEFLEKYPDSDKATKAKEYLNRIEADTTVVNR